MPDKRAHRGPHPEDRELFGPSALLALSVAYRDFCWLLDRDYAPTAALALVGDRYALRARQRIAIARCACSERAADRRQAKLLTVESLAQQILWIDGFNLLVTLEAGLAGGLVLEGRDGAYRDLASIHGTYRKVAETPAACEWVGRALQEANVAACRWWLDKPVSNSGRLKTLLLAAAARHGWNWEVELAADVDAILCRASVPVATADSRILDECANWVNLARWLIERETQNPWVLRF